MKAKINQQVAVCTMAAPETQLHNTHNARSWALKLHTSALLGRLCWRAAVGTSGSGGSGGRGGNFAAAGSRCLQCARGCSGSKAYGLIYGGFVRFGGRLVRSPWLMRSSKYWPILCLIKYLGDGHYSQVSATHYAR